MSTVYTGGGKWNISSCNLYFGEIKQQSKDWRANPLLGCTNLASRVVVRHMCDIRSLKKNVSVISGPSSKSHGQ